MIKHIKLSNFRKFKLFDEDINSNLVIFKGKNAIGKTSILESIYLISTFKSHRTNSYLNLIKENSNFAKIEIDADSKYEIIISENGKKGLVDKVEIKKASDYIGRLKCVMFSPEDIKIVSGGNSNKRNFLDLEISLLNKRYLEVLKESKYFLSQRNQLLKKYDAKKDKKILDFLTLELSKREKLIILSRIKFLNMINEKINEIHKQIKNDEVIKFKYISSFKDIDDESKYHDNLEQDLLYKMTLRGIGRDYYKISINGNDIEAYASEGQLKNIAISLKIALVKIMKEYTNKEVILLLDDVFSLLDKNRINNLYELLKLSNQTFITCVDSIELDKKLKDEALIIDLEKKENLYG